MSVASPTDVRERRRCQYVIARRTVERADRLGLLDCLGYRDRLVIEMRYGVARQPATRVAIAERFAVTYGRVIQLERKAMGIIVALLDIWGSEEIGLGVSRCPRTDADAMHEDANGWKVSPP